MTDFYRDEINELKYFCKSKCESRDETHSHIHMFKVADNCKKIYDSMFIEDPNHTNPLYLVVQTVALLHDINDHKYQDSELENDLKSFLYDFYERRLEYDGIVTLDQIYKIIKYISYSNEVKNGTTSWYSELGSIGCLIRDIVSDADKLEAIGLDGLIRCKKYTIESFINHYKTEPSEEYVKENVKEHYHEKLSKLANQFMRTDMGKKLAMPLNKEMEDNLNNLDKI